VSLCHYLRNSRPTFGRLGSVVNILIVYTINTGLVTVIDATAGLICFAVMPTNFVYVAFYLILSKLYLNAYLASLNARVSLRERNEYASSTINMDSLFPPAPARSSLDVSQPSGAVKVEQNRLDSDATIDYRIQDPSPSNELVFASFDRSTEIEAQR